MAALCREHRTNRPRCFWTPSRQPSRSTPIALQGLEASTPGATPRCATKRRMRTASMLYAESSKTLCQFGVGCANRCAHMRMHARSDTSMLHTHESLRERTQLGTRVRCLPGSGSVLTQRGSEEPRRAGDYPQLPGAGLLDLVGNRSWHIKGAKQMAR